MQTISVIGLGVMGSALAHELLAAGYDVTVWNRTPDKSEPVVSAGASLADTASDAVGNSEVTITCIRSHGDTRALLEVEPSMLKGKTVIELSTGNAEEATSLKTFIENQGADCLIGMIATFPSGIGQSDSAIVTIGEDAVWKRCATILKVLAGKSSCIGTEPKALAAIYASLFLPRQGFMFGMIYGALICEKAGVSMEAYVEQLPLTIKVVNDYFDVFASSVPNGDFSNPPASMGTYLAAFEDTLNTCRELGVPEDFPGVLHSHVKQGVAAGLADQQITALTKILNP